MPDVSIQIGSVVQRFQSTSDRSLLDHAIEAGISVNYSCRRGDCGQCIATLHTGDVAALNPTQPHRVHRDIYLCNTTACSDLELHLPYFPELADVPTMRSPTKIHELKLLSADVVEVVLRLPPAINFRFLPGQFVRLTTKGGLTRSYSLAAGPDSSKTLRIQVRRVAGGAFSDYLFTDAKPGDLLHLEGPSGHFFLRQSRQAKRTLFLATGTGIAPIYGMLSAMTEKQRPLLGEIDVYWGNRTQQDEYLAPALQALSSKLDFRYWPLHSRQPENSQWRHVQDLAASHHVDLAESVAYACGNPAMIDQARRRCVELGMMLDDFHSDPFTAS